MHLSTLIDMIESGFADRVLLGTDSQPVTGARLAHLARCGATTLTGPSVVYAGENHPLLPVLALAAGAADVTYVPVNYRLKDNRLNALIGRHPDAVVVTDARTGGRVTAPSMTMDEWLASLPDDHPLEALGGDEHDVAIVLYTSGTTSEPKSALLRHRHLMGYLLGTVEFGAGGPEEAALISVPPYHIAGVANLLSNLFAGRRAVYVSAFDPEVWLRTVADEGITNAMVVPTMLARIVETLEGAEADVPTLRAISYGGAKVSERVLISALRCFLRTDFVNAYGLTETTSTIALLGPEDYRAAIASDDPLVRRRLSSAGRLLPGIEIEIRDDDGTPLPSNLDGMIFLRGQQISGEYESGSVLDDEGWFCTRDREMVDDVGYLFIAGRADDTIIRGGENIATAEIEEVLLTHSDVAEACVVGVPDDEWGQRIVAVVVRRTAGSVAADELHDLVRSKLRGSKTPDRIVCRDMLAHGYRQVVAPRRPRRGVGYYERLTTHRRFKMTISISPGTRFFSAVCSTELIAVKASGEPVLLTIGGAPPVTSSSERDGDAAPAGGHDGGTAMGKRYVDDDDTIELLCTKPGPGVPALDGTLLQLKEAKQLPASD